MRIVSVTFRNGAQPTHWAVVSDFGGKAEVKESCHHYGGRFCIYPWYSSSTGGSWHFGVHYPDTISDYGRANQYAQATHCGGRSGRTAPTAPTSSARTTESGRREYRSGRPRPRSATVVAILP